MSEQIPNCPNCGKTVALDYWCVYVKVKCKACGLDGQKFSDYEGDARQLALDAWKKLCKTWRKNNALAS